MPPKKEQQAAAEAAAAAEGLAINLAFRFATKAQPIKSRRASRDDADNAAPSPAATPAAAAVEGGGASRPASAAPFESMGLRLQYSLFGEQEQMTPTFADPAAPFEQERRVTVTEQFVTDLQQRPQARFKLVMLETPSATPVPEEPAAGGKKDAKKAAPKVTETRADKVILEFTWDLAGLLMNQTKLSHSESLVKTSIFGGPSNLDSIELSMQTAETLLSDEMVERLNPLAITVVSVDDLPSNPNGFRDLREKCHPAYVSYSFFDLEEKIKTQPMEQKSCLRFNHLKVFFAAEFEYDKLFDYLRSTPLKVEVHDRDVARVERSEDDPEPVLSFSGLTSLDASLAARPPPPDPYGVADVSLSELCDADGSRSFVVRSNVQPMRIKPDTNESEPRKPNGDYIENGTCVTVKVQLSKSLKPLDSAGPFHRAVFRFRYGNTKLLRRLLDAIEVINGEAMGLDPSMTPAARAMTLPTMQVEPADIADENGLNLVTGFQVADADFRVIVVEGLEGSIKSLVEAHPRPTRTTVAGGDYKLLYNPEVTFDRRLYASFHCVIKIIKLRDCLKTYAAAPDIFVVDKVHKECSVALQKLCDLVKATRMRLVKVHCLLPSAIDLSELDKKFGDVLSNADIDGLPVKEEDFVNEDMDTLKNMGQEELARQLAEGAANGEALTGRRRRKPPLDMSNDIYVAYRLEHVSEDYIEKNKLACQVEAPREPRPQVDYGEVYVYSGQKLQFTELQKEALRKRLAKDTKNYYTYSMEYGSLALSMVNEDEMEKDAKEQSKAKFTTPGGFVYPAPKPISEYTRHPKAPSDSRKQELEDAWIENEQNPNPLKKAPIDLQGKPDFNTHPAHPGRQLNDDPDFVRSVHDSGVGAQLAAREDTEKAYREWKDKVVVNDPKIHTYARGLGRPKPGQLDRGETLLKDPPQTLALKKQLPVEEMHATMFLDDVPFDASQVHKQRTWIVPPKDPNAPADISDQQFRRISALPNRPKMHKRAAAPLTEGDRTTAVWAADDASQVAAGVKGHDQASNYRSQFLHAKLKNVLDTPVGAPATPTACSAVPAAVAAVAQD